MGAPHELVDMERFQRDGYAIIPNFMDRELTARLRTLIDDVAGPTPGLLTHEGARGDPKWNQEGNK